MINDDLEIDYNKNPIIIEDKMPNIGFFMFLCTAIFPLVAIIGYMKINNQMIDWIHVSISLAIIYIPTYFLLAMKIAEKKTIKLFEDSIERMWDEDILKISIIKEIKLKKGFIDYYDKSQEVPTFILLLKPIFYPLMKIIYQPYLLLVKLIYKKINNFTYLEKNDTLYLFSENNVISIFIEDVETYNKLSTYFKRKNIDLSDTKKFDKVDYNFYGINSTKKQ